MSADGDTVVSAILDADVLGAGEEFVPGPWMGKIGIFSAEGAELHGTVFYATPDGREVEVSLVCDAADIDGVNWEDKVVVGPVDKFLRPGKPGMLRLAGLMMDESGSMKEAYSKVEATIMKEDD
jgi:hypothetical protein